MSKFLTLKDFAREMRRTEQFVQDRVQRGSIPGPDFVADGTIPIWTRERAQTWINAYATR